MMLRPCRGPALGLRHRRSITAQPRQAPLRSARPPAHVAAAAAAAAAPPPEQLSSYATLRASSVPPVAPLPTPPDSTSAWSVATYLARLAVGEKQLLWRVGLAFVFMVRRRWRRHAVAHGWSGRLMPWSAVPECARKRAPSSAAGARACATCALLAQSRGLLQA